MMAEAAALHAPRWDDPALQSLDWLVARPARASATLRETLPPIIRLFEDRYRDALEPEFMVLVEKLPEVLARSREDQSSPHTVQHADFRLDNVLFDVKNGARPMATLDWQTLRTGPGAMDVAYFLSAGLDPSERRRHEADLVRLHGLHAAAKIRHDSNSIAAVTVELAQRARLEKSQRRKSRIQRGAKERLLAE